MGKDNTFLGEIRLSSTQIFQRTLWLLSTLCHRRLRHRPMHLFLIGCVSVLTLAARDGFGWVYISASPLPVEPLVHGVMVHPLTTSLFFFTVMV